MELKTTRFNPLDYMETQDEINLYLAECVKESDPKIFINAIGHLVKKHGESDIPEAIGVNRESLYKSFNGKTMPRGDTVRNIMNLLHVDVTVTAH
ncbi:MAG TPA: putative addiction module antidote protein [Psychromonas hadalis]|nr:putative addiction module antidote protein [Psychromonas hadalis]